MEYIIKLAIYAAKGIWQIIGTGKIFVQKESRKFG